MEKRKCFKNRYRQRLGTDYALSPNDFLNINFYYYLPWIWVPFDDFLTILSPSITIIKNVYITCCLHNNPRLSHCLASITIPTVCFIFSLPKIKHTRNKHFKKLSNSSNVQKESDVWIFYHLFASGSLPQSSSSPLLITDNSSSPSEPEVVLSSC